MRKNLKYHLPQLPQIRMVHFVAAGQGARHTLLVSHLAVLTIRSIGFHGRVVGLIQHRVCLVSPRSWHERPLLWTITLTFVISVLFDTYTFFA